jgi:hypothetical protein
VQKSESLVQKNEFEEPRLLSVRQHPGTSPQIQTQVVTVPVKCATGYLHYHHGAHRTDDERYHALRDGVESDESLERAERYRDLSHIFVAPQRL